jgi:hypothetical protein
MQQPTKQKRDGATRGRSIMRGQHARQRLDKRRREAGVLGNTTQQPTKLEGRNERMGCDERGRGGQGARQFDVIHHNN